MIRSDRNGRHVICTGPPCPSRDTRKANTWHWVRLKVPPSLVHGHRLLLGNTTSTITSPPLPPKSWEGAGWDNENRHYAALRFVPTSRSRCAGSSLTPRVFSCLRMRIPPPAGPASPGRRGWLALLTWVNETINPHLIGLREFSANRGSLLLILP